MIPWFDRSFIDLLPLFKAGLGGQNETVMLRQAVRDIAGTFDHTKTPSFLDIGSGDGDWLRKVATCFRDELEFRGAGFTPVEPVSDNPLLARVCQSQGFASPRFDPIEECKLTGELYNVILSTHSAYYYFNQPLAHEVMFDALKPGGWMVVTLVSQFCVLNALTEDILGPHHQVALNAEAYISLVAKIGYFSLKKIVSHEGGYLDVDLYINSVQHLRALQAVLARHRLPSESLEATLDRFANALRRHSRRSRLNLIMFFQKSSWPRHAAFDPGIVLESKAKAALDDLGAALRAAADVQPEVSRALLEADLRSFAAEASTIGRHDVLAKIGDRIVDEIANTGGRVNVIQDYITAVIDQVLP